MKKLFFFFVSFCFYLATSFAQAPTIQWQNTIGGNDEDVLRSLQQTFDGGFILGGESNSNISGDKIENSLGGVDYWIVKLDSSGNIQWQNTIGGNDDEWLYSVKQTFDGGYILGGTSKSNVSGDKTENNLGVEDYWVVKLDTQGNIQWQNTIGGSDDDALNSIQQTSDGGYILGGTSKSYISGDKTENNLGGYDYWIIKLDSLGVIIWQNTIGGNDRDWAASVQETFDGGYIIDGNSISNISGDKAENSWGNYDFWIIKLDSSGNILWQNTIGGSDMDGLLSTQQTSDAGFILGGYSYSNISGDKTENCISGGPFCYPDYWVIKLAPDTITGISPTPTLLEEEGVTVFPNPAQDFVVISSEFGDNKKAQLTITDLYRQGNLSPNSPNSQLPTPDFFLSHRHVYNKGVFG